MAKKVNQDSLESSDASSIRSDTPYLKFKMIVDKVLAFTLIIALVPLVLLIAFIIRIDSAGPMFYKQKRVGSYGKHFVLYKFRTMKIGTPTLSTEEMQKLNYIPITRFGQILRKTSLDELPQLINILKGEMSFIGPRPALPSQIDVNTLREKYGVYKIPPGLTGLAQVMGRDDIDAKTKVDYDFSYCRNICLAMDVYVLFLTVKAVLTARGNK